MEGRGVEDAKTDLDMEGWEGCDVIPGSRVTYYCVVDAGDFGGLLLSLMIAFEAYEHAVTCGGLV
jgi:hypothetical protein